MNSENTADRTPNKKGSNLTERELLKHSVIVIQEDELKKLRVEIKEILSSYKHKYFYEALLVSVALATGRTVEGVLELSLNPNDYEYITSQVGEDGKSRTAWVVEGERERLNLPLPELIQFAIRRTISEKNHETLSDYLPQSSQSWSRRSYKWLSNHVTGSEYYLRIKVRDTLARKIYERSANSSILTFLLTEREQWRTSESLSSYIDLVCQQTVDIYKDALGYIFGNIGKFPSNTHKKYIDLQGSVIPKVSEFMRNKVRESEQDFIEHHNWVARYCLTMLLFCTGHRKSKTPFYFPWDVDTESELAFICDKSVVGSEARFVPIAGMVSAQIKAYKLHLIDLANKLRASSPELSRLINRLGLGGDISTLNDEVELCGHFAMFFTLTKELRARTISTKDIEDCCAELGEFEVRKLRSLIAQYLYATGKSGMQIEALLGHNGENHIFGAASTWTVKKWAESIRITQDSYLSDMGWKKIDIPANVSKISGKPSEIMPLFTASNYSYEGRLRSKEVSRLKATIAVKRNWPEDWLYGHANLINENDIRELKNKVITELQYDLEAQRKINYVINREIDRITDATVTSSTVNLFRTEPGPIEVTASRNLDIASKIRSWWVDDLGHFRTGSSDKAQEYLVKIGLNLVIFDAVLDIQIWDALMLEIMSNATVFLDECLLVHGRVAKANKVFEKSLIPTPVTQSLIVGYTRQMMKCKETNSLEQIKKSIQIKIDKMPVASRVERRDLEALMYIFRSYWLIRLPGSLYAISIGQNSGPAADLQSELSLMGFEACTQGVIKSVEKARQNFFTSHNHINTSAKVASSQINALFEMAQGKFELEGAVSKVQRKRLREIIEENIPVTLSQIADQQIIVRVFIDFIKYLLIEGGQRKDRLKFSTIRTYISSLRPLISLFWDMDLYEMDTESYKKVYEEYFEINRDQVTNADGRVQLFHRFLRDTVDAPYCFLGFSQNNIPAECRSVVITKSDFDSTWDMVDQIDFESQEVKNAVRSYLSLGYSFGLRRKEAYGLEGSQILINEDAGILIKRNKYRDLKSLSSKRLVPSFFLGKKQKKHLSNQSHISNISADGNECLFKDASERKQLLSTNKIDNYVRILLRINTKNIDVVPYSMRHTAATRLAHFSIISPRKIPFSDQVNQALASENDQTFFETFIEGFKAWPFWMDRVAMFLGHRDVETLLDNYWHTSSIKMAEYTWFENEVDLEHIKDEHLGNLLGLGRTTIVNMRKRLELKNSNSISNEILIKHYVSLEGEVDLARNADADSLKIAEEEFSKITLNSMQEMSWIFLDKLLVWRLTKDVSLADMKNKVLSTGLKGEEVDLLIESYKNLVCELDFDDFEPIGSELLVKKKDINNGVVRGKAERRIGLANVQKFYETSSEFAGELEKFVEIWTTRVNFKDPWFVAKNEADIRVIIKVLTKIGVSETQLEFSACHGFDFGIVKAIFSNHMQSQQVKHYDKRISRGNPNAIISELGIKINQEKDAKIGDGRDAHRLIFLVAVLMQM